jgi:hypothetical protein
VTLGLHARRIRVFEVVKDLPQHLKVVMRKLRFPFAVAAGDGEGTRFPPRCPR